VKRVNANSNNLIMKKLSRRQFRLKTHKVAFIKYFTGKRNKNMYPTIKLLVYIVSSIYYCFPIQLFGFFFMDSKSKVLHESCSFKYICITFLCIKKKLDFRENTLSICAFRSIVYTAVNSINVCAGIGGITVVLYTRLWLVI